MRKDEKFQAEINRINKDYGHRVSFDLKNKYLRKFGRNIDLDTNVEEMIWITGGIEDLPTDNLITHFASSSLSDTGISLIVEGHTIDGSGNLTFVTQAITLAARTKTALGTPLARVTRCYNDGATSFVGTIYVARNVTFTDGVPASDIHLTVLPEDQQSLKAATSISSSDYWIINTVIFSVKRSASAVVDFKFQVRLKNGVWRTQFATSISSSQSVYQFVDEDNPLIVPPNSDIRIEATSSANNATADAIFSGPLGIIY